jgi:prophage regulatory protein
MDATIRVIRRRELLGMIGLSCSTQWRLEKAGQFPARVRLGKGSVGWRLTEVEAWVWSRKKLP